MASNTTLGTVTILHRESIGSQTEKIATVSIGTHYPTGGKLVTADAFGLDSIYTFQIVEPFTFSTVMYTAIFDRANSKIIVYAEDGTSGVNAQVADDTDLSTIIISVRVRGY